MGLDMWLTKRKKVTQEDELMYWRKANQIRGWFCNNVDGFTDNASVVVPKEKLEELAATLKNHIQEINSINGNSVTVRMTTACHLRSEEGMSDETIYPITLKEIDDKEGNVDN